MNERLEKRAIELIDEAESIVGINIYKLEKELQYQAVYYRNYSSLLADLQEQKNKLRSQVDSEERTRYTNAKGKPPSEAYIESVIKNDRELIEIQVLIEKLDSTLKSLDHKKKALECLVQLELAGYYSEPRVNREE